MSAREGTREWCMQQLHDHNRRRTVTGELAGTTAEIQVLTDIIDAAWETLGESENEHDSLPEAIETVVARIEARIGDLTLQLGKAKQHADDLDKAMEPLMQQTRTIEADITAARVEGYRLGRNSTLDRIEAALGKSPEPESFTRGIVAALRASLTWRDR